jgi:hypothetical protein
VFEDRRAKRHARQIAMQPAHLQLDDGTRLRQEDAAIVTQRKRTAGVIDPAQKRLSALCLSDKSIQTLTG